MRLKLDEAPRYFRSSVLRAAPGGVDRKAGVIHGYSVITVGEALGHGMWIDGEMLGQVIELGNAAPKGIKSRFTHPDISSDGMGKHLGRSREFVADGDQVRADLHMARAASRSPSGDLSGYVLELADEDPEAFGASIVFMRDLAAEREFLLAHGATEDEDGYLNTRSFRSPDPHNVGNFRHARVKALMASDVVDEPAANPGGFFSAEQETAAKAEHALGFVLGLTTQQPEASAFGVHPERARQFVSRFLDNRGLKVVPKEDAMSKTTDAAPETPAAPTKKTATLAELKGAFPDRPEFVLGQLEAGASMDEATAAFQELRIAELEADKADLETRNAELAAKAKLGEKPNATKPLPGVDPVDFNSTDQGEGGGDFMELARAFRDEKHPHLSTVQKRMGIGMREAITACQKAHPQAYAAWRGRQSNLTRRVS